MRKSLINNLTPEEVAWARKTEQYFGLSRKTEFEVNDSVYDIAYNGKILLGRRFLEDTPNSDRRHKKIVHELLHAAGYPHSAKMNAAGYYSKPRKDRLSEKMRDEIKAGVPRFIPSKFGLPSTDKMKPVSQKDIDTSWKHDTWKADIKETITQGRSSVEVEGVTEEEALANLKKGQHVPGTYHHTTVGKVTKLDVLSLKKKPYDSGKMAAIKNPDDERMQKDSRELGWHDLKNRIMDRDTSLSDRDLEEVFDTTADWNHRWKRMGAPYQYPYDGANKQNNPAAHERNPRYPSTTTPTETSNKNPNASDMHSLKVAVIGLVSLIALTVLQRR